MPDEYALSALLRLREERVDHAQQLLGKRVAQKQQAAVAANEAEQRLVRAREQHRQAESEERGRAARPEGVSAAEMQQLVSFQVGAKADEQQLARRAALMAQRREETAQQKRSAEDQLQAAYASEKLVARHRERHVARQRALEEESQQEEAEEQFDALQFRR